MARVKIIAVIAAAGFSLSGCVIGSAVGAVVDTAGTAASTAVGAAGDVVEAGADVASAPFDGDE
ncbi:MAG: hypothetical protein ACFB2Z_01955 [Maricaulaceae bacterium]